MAALRDPNKLAISPPPSLIEVDQVCQTPTATSHNANCLQKASPSDDLSNYDTTSITASIVDYEYENGRRYHSYRAGSYPLPNDEQELDRIDLKHHIMRLLCSGHLYIAPLDSPKRILDLGTGTGIWPIEMGEQHPGSEVHGVDLSPVQPNWVPDNVHLAIDDIEDQNWCWPDNHFDYVHSRFMLCSISNWKRYIRKAFQHTKPGGYFELQELDCRFSSDDGSLREDSAISYWSDAITEASANYNRPIPRYGEYYDWFVQAGFVDIKQVILKSPTNPWPKDPKLKEIGRYQLLAHVEGIEGVSMGLLTRGSQWKAEEVSVLVAKMKPELKDRAVHSYQTNVVLVGRKPEFPRTPDSMKDGLSYGWKKGAPGAP
ncbi:uncharacterized protein KY384_004364 [Bacidia gigantensis]|uniref:uncharacterized protein n=1 Tax=Bacidia gigantensis TaxID=2732470 RepID=UPI001D048775|nr:uncharacterized protein KY384_004364 [Bacidia gigantensis]KAG8531007.1 hypothetical protein KY384_004364 [Bacidia gigantensis]